MDELVSLECLNMYDPPKVRVTLLGQPAFDVSWGAYMLLHNNFGFPPLVCGDYSTEA